MPKRRTVHRGSTVTRTWAVKSVSLSNVLWERLDAEARARRQAGERISRSVLVEMAVRAFFK